MTFLIKYRVQLLQGLLALGLAWMVYHYGKKFVQWLKKEGDYVDTVAVPAQSKLSYPREEYRAMADALEQELSSLFGISMDGAIEILQRMNTREDMHQLIISFGKRDLGVWPFDEPGANLVKWIHGRMWGSDLETAKEIFARLGMSI